MKIKPATKVLPFAGLLLLAACSDSEPSQPATDNSSTPTQTDQGNKAATESLNLNLNSSSLDRQQFLGLVIPESPVVAPCPYLSDEAALAAVKTSWELVRRETSNDQCYWSKNAGFSIKLTIEPLATAIPVRDRPYNIDTPPVLKAQAEPGNNAMVLYDTAWEKELAYALSFEQDDKLVMIYITGMNTDATLLTAAAKKVASNLPTAPVLTAQPDDTNGFNMCNTWTQAEVASLLGKPLEITEDKLDCKWQSGEGLDMKQIQVGIYSGKSYPFETLLEEGAVAVSGVGERSLMLKRRQKSNVPGYVLLNALYDEKLVAVTVTNTVKNHEAVALALAKNIDERLQ